MSKKSNAKKQAKKQSSQVPREISKQDFSKFRPEKIQPGVLGRTQWFAERAGRRDGALSLGRLQQGLQQTGRMFSDRARQALHREQTLSVLHQLEREGVKPASKMTAYTDQCERCKIGTGRRRKKDGFSLIGSPFKVEASPRRPVNIFLPVDEKTIQMLDLEAIVVAEVSDKHRPRLVDTFSFLEAERLIVGRLFRSGQYRVYALPKHPWLKAAFHTICHYWPWIQYESQLMQLTGSTDPESTTPLADRICQLILCREDLDQIKDPDIFRRMGTGLPPGRDFTDFEKYRGQKIPGRTPDLPGGTGNICDRCVGEFLGELEVDRGLLLPHPLIWWCRWPRWRCGRWVSAGPYPSAGFSGIGRVTQIDIDPFNPNRLIAGSCGGGVWLTLNGGQYWRPLMDTEPTLTIGAVAIAPSNTNVFYAASGEDGGFYNPAWAGIGLYRSGDGGSTWSVMTPVDSTRFSAIVVHPRNENLIYLAGNRGLHKSFDGGLTWQSNPGHKSLFDAVITDVVIAHNDPDRIYFGVHNDGVYRSIDGGATYTRLDGPTQLPSGITAGWIKLTIGRNGANGTRFVAAKMGTSGSRMFSTADGGNNWTELASNIAAVSYDEWCSVIAVDPNDEQILYAGGATTLQRCSNGGFLAADWTSIYAGVHADQQDIAFSLLNSATLFLANDGGVYRTTDRGNNWDFRSGNLRITQMYDIDISEKDRDVVIGGAQDNGVYYRNVIGQWTHIPWGDGTQTAIDPTDPDIFYFSSQNGLPNWLRKSVNGGASHQALGTNGLSGASPWITIIKLDPTDPIVDPANNRTLFVCGYDVLFRSTDGGQNWQRVEDGAGVPFTTFGTITALEYAPSDPHILYLGTSNGALYRAINGGAMTADWTRIDTVASPADALFPNVQIQSLRINPHDPDEVWVVFGGAGVNFTNRPDLILNPLGISHLFRTRDGGANWTDVSGSFPGMSLPDVPTSAVAISDFNPDVAFVGTDVGVFKTEDGGTTWASYMEDLPRVPITELRFNRTYNRLFAGTMGRGIYYRDV